MLSKSSTKPIFSQSKGTRLRWLLQYAAVPLILLIVWELAVDYDWVPRSLIAGPSAVAHRFFEMAGDGTLARHIGVSVQRLVLGFGLGTTLGVLLGVFVAFQPAATRIFEPTVLSLIPIPPIAWIPLLIILLGIRRGVARSPPYRSEAFGTSSCRQPTESEQATKCSSKWLALNKDNRALLWRVLFPSALPGILSSMRVALALSWTLLIASEVIASSSGLGWLIWNARNFSRPNDMFVGMATVGLLGKLSDWGLVVLEAKLTRWRRAFRDA